MEALDRGNRDLRKANEILRLTRAFSLKTSSTALQILRTFIHEHRRPYGVEAICRAM